jgi:hypothetical protein
MGYMAFLEMLYSLYFLQIIYVYAILRLIRKENPITSDNPMMGRHKCPWCIAMIVMPCIEQRCRAFSVYFSKFFYTGDVYELIIKYNSKKKKKNT